MNRSWLFGVVLLFAGCGNPTAPVINVTVEQETITEIDICHVELRVIRLQDGSYFTNVLSNRRDGLGWICWLIKEEDRPVVFGNVELTNSTWETYICETLGRPGC